MDTIRTVYCDSQHARERNGTYILDLQGGIAIPEGARTMVDNVSFTNTFSEEVTEENKWVYMKTFEEGTATDVRDKDWGFAWDSGPQKKNAMHGNVQVRQGLYQPVLSRTRWKDGTTELTFSTGAGYGMFTLTDGTTTWNLFAYNVTPVSFQFWTDYNGGNLPGTYADGVLNITGGSNLIADHDTGLIFLTTPRNPVLDLSGTWTSSGISMVISVGASPFSWVYTRSAPGTIEEGQLVVLDVHEGKQNIDKFVQQHPSNAAFTESAPQLVTGQYDPLTGILVLDGEEFTSPNNTITLNKPSFEEETAPKNPSLSGRWTTGTTDIFFDQQITIPSIENAAIDWARTGLDAATWTVNDASEYKWQYIDNNNATINNAVGTWIRDGGAQWTVEQTSDNRHYRYYNSNISAYRYFRFTAWNETAGTATALWGYAEDAQDYYQLTWNSTHNRLENDGTLNSGTFHLSPDASLNFSFTGDPGNSTGNTNIMQFTHWDEHAKEATLTETLPNGTVLTFTWDEPSKEFQAPAGTSYNWKPVWTQARPFAFKGVYPSLGVLGVQAYKAHGSTAMGGTVVVDVTDFSATEIFVAAWKTNTYNSNYYCHGTFTVATKELVWSGAISETWTYQGDNIFVDLANIKRFALESTPGVAFCFAEADTAIETTLYDLTGDWELVSVTAGTSVPMVLVCNPTDSFPYSFRLKSTGAVYLDHFRMRRRHIEWQTTQSDVANLKPEQGVIGLAAFTLQRNQATPATGASFGKELVLPMFDLVYDIVSGTTTTVGEVLQEPFPGTFSATADSLLFTSAAGFSSPVLKMNDTQLSLFYSESNMLVLSTDVLGTRSDVGTTNVSGCPLEIGKYNSATAFASGLQTALNKAPFDNVFTVTAVGANMQVSASGGMKVSLLGDTQAALAFPGEDLNSANRWLKISTDTGVSDLFTFGPVSLPRDINSLYLHSDTLAGFRDTMGPMPNTRGTIAKISLGGTRYLEYHSESLYRPHLYSTMPLSTLSSIDFALRDSLGNAQSLEGTNFAFVVTFDTSHLAI